ncbi:MAG TPA: hypothetical protein VMD79_16370 [Solirubrobacteraceae bacterium]|nr:hypothetical protein [Solirubrobacteraceae bacterium]
MSEPSQPSPASPASGQAGADGEQLTADALPVLAEGVRVMPARQAAAALSSERRVAIPAVGAAAVAAGSFVAGAAVVGLVHRRQRRTGALSKRSSARRAVKRSRAGAHSGGRAGGKTAELVQIVSSRSLLVDVHLLGGPGGR